MNGVSDQNTANDHEHTRHLPGASAWKSTM
jgi:hypothetical protein